MNIGKKYNNIPKIIIDINLCENICSFNSKVYSLILLNNFIFFILLKLKIEK